MLKRQIARHLRIPCRDITSLPRRSLRSSVPVLLTLSLPLSDATLFANDLADSKDSLRLHKLAELRTALSWRYLNPSRVWAVYTGVVNVVGAQDIPLELHQDVLRNCTASAAEVRLAVARSSIQDRTKHPTHIHEDRFKTIIRNIRSGGWSPSLDDYHFILQQFASAGHHVGSINVYQELMLKGPRPIPKTYGLCLQAIAHRLTFPCPSTKSPALISDTRKHCATLWNDMFANGIPLTSPNLDLTVRIMKETLDRKAFESLLKVAYGIDLTYPDRADLSYIDNSNIDSTFGAALRDTPSPHPFSTAALNTIIDVLGRLGDVSKLVQAFEVLTQPLPPRALQRYSPSFDDDEEDFIPEPTSELRPPYAAPNTTTYCYLLRYISRADHAALARHYLLQAIEIEWRTDRALRGELMTKPLYEVTAPSFAVNRGMLLSVFSQCNRDKNTQLMRWLASKLPKIIRRKRLNLEWHSAFREKLSEVQTLFSENTEGVSPSVTPDAPLSSSASFPSLHSVNSDAVSDREHRTKSIHVLDLDLDAPLISSTPFRHFYFDTHLKILQRDLEEIELFATQVNDVLGRTTQRVKERLGRRVWQGKNIYLLNEGQRITLSRPAWRKIVNFKPRYQSLSKTVVDRPATRLPSSPQGSQAPLP